jgi:hypothetical protein
MGEIFQLLGLARLRIDIEVVYSAGVVDYAFKSLKTGNASLDDIPVYH